MLAFINFRCQLFCAHSGLTFFHLTGFVQESPASTSTPLPPSFGLGFGASSTLLIGAVMDIFESLGLTFNASRLTRDQRDKIRSEMQGALDYVNHADSFAKAIGNLSIDWAHLDRKLDELFQPLLNCTAEEVACILVENIDARCSQLKRLITVAKPPRDWRDWIFAVLNRAANEIGPKRNRLLHDTWDFRDNTAARTDKRAKIKQAQSRQEETLSFDTKHPVSAEEIELLTSCVFTVSMALDAAKLDLVQWREEGRFPEFDPQWIPAGKPTARCSAFRLTDTVPPRPVPPEQFELG